jgi:hypothetical protein
LTALKTPLPSLALLPALPPLPPLPTLRTLPPCSYSPQLLSQILQTMPPYGPMPPPNPLRGTHFEPMEIDDERMPYISKLPDNELDLFLLFFLIDLIKKWIKYINNVKV